MKIRMKVGILGTFHNIEAGSIHDEPCFGAFSVIRGDVVDIDKENAQRYCANGIAEPA